ncbi:MAG TPA: GNAT family N-acetyltransferase [Actinomycetes bacterium]|nr:GNAT family N-acetyltransferase [Actinomycetes bacterium]
MTDVVSQPAIVGDLDAITEVMTVAFAGDPVWDGWAFPSAHPELRNQQRRSWWRFNLASALRYPWVRMSPGRETVALWIPPGGEELTPDEERELPAFLDTLVGGFAGTFIEGLELFDSSHPHGEPHYYLSLLGTHDDHRGKGLGMALLAENLALIDAEHMPAYLESSNPGNLPRYERLGFSKVGEFTLPAGGPTVDTMWRPAR